MITALRRRQEPEKCHTLESPVPASVSTTISCRRRGVTESVRITGRSLDYADVNRIAWNVVAQMAPALLDATPPSFPNTRVDRPYELEHVDEPSADDWRLGTHDPEPWHMSPESAVLDEFSSYFNADEANAVPHVLEASVGRIAAESAARMLRAVDPDQRAALVELLRALRNERSHPLHERIADRTMIAWTETEEEFALFGRLIDAIIDDIKSAGLS